MSSSVPSGSSAKRKHPAHTNGNDKLSISIHPLSSSSTPPVLVSFPSVYPPESTPFSLYQPSGDPEDDPVGDLLKIAGHTDHMELSGDLYNNGDANPDYSCKYVLALLDPSASTLTMAPTQTFILNRAVKRLKPTTERQQTEVKDYLARAKDRNALGEAFGTRKSKSRIKAAERNAVDTAGMEGSRKGLLLGVEQGGQNMLSAEGIQELEDSSRSIPPFNINATTAADVYGLSAIVSATAMNAIRPIAESIARTSGEDADQKRKSLLPWRHSRWLNDRMESVVLLADKPKTNMKKLRIIVFISAMRTFHRYNRFVGDPTALAEKMSNTPSAVTDALVEMFTETERGQKPTMTPSMENKLLLYLLTLYLMLDDFAVDPAPVAKDLSLPIMKINKMFRSLGCKVEPATGEARETVRDKKEKEKVIKKAILKVPLEFPKVSRGRK